MHAQDLCSCPPIIYPTLEYRSIRTPGDGLWNSTVRLALPSQVTATGFGRKQRIAEQHAATEAVLKLRVQYYDLFKTMLGFSRRLEVITCALYEIE